MAPKRKSIEKASADAKPAKEEKKQPKKAKAGALAVGDDISSIADIELLNDEDKTVTLRELVKDKGAVIFFYPRANTGGCTKQACGFLDNYSKIEKAGYNVFGMSFDKPKSQSNWKTKYDLPYNLLTVDSDGTVLKAFGGFKLPKNVVRGHVVIGKGGKMIDVRNGISPGDSFAEATKTVTGGK